MLAIWELARSPTRVRAWWTLGYLSAERWGARSVISVTTTWLGYWPDMCTFLQSLRPVLRAQRAVQPPQHVIMVGAGIRTEPMMVQKTMAVSVSAIRQRWPLAGVHTELAPPEASGNANLRLTSPRGEGSNLSKGLGCQYPRGVQMGQRSGANV